MALRVLCSIVVMALALPWAGWIVSSPMMRYSDKFAGHVFFPADGPDDRFQYLQHLVISRGDRIRYATCVLCSVMVNGSVDRATALWGNVTIAPGGSARGVEVIGGRITALSQSELGIGQVVAVGGSVIISPGVNYYRNSVFSAPGLFYPGQRSWPARGVALFVVFVLLVAACGGVVVSGSFRELVGAEVRHPARSAAVGIVLGALAVPLFSAGMSLWYFAPPLAIVLLFATTLVYWFVVAVGFAAVAESLGSRWWSATGVVARVTGAALLILLMLVPVAGMLVVVALNFVSLGVGMGAFLWRRSQQVGAEVTRAR